SSGDIAAVDGGSAIGDAADRAVIRDRARDGSARYGDAGTDCYARAGVLNCAASVVYVAIKGNRAGPIRQKRGRICPRAANRKRAVYCESWAGERRCSADGQRGPGILRNRG